MKKRNLILAILCLALGFALAACSDDDEEKLDKGIQKEAGVDMPKKTPDAGPDKKVTKPDKGPDGVTTPDVGPDGVTKPDISLDSAPPDITPDITVLPDMPKPSCTLPFNYITLSGGKGSAKGEIKSTDKTSKVNLAKTGCTSLVTLGAEHIYAVYLSSSTKYFIGVTPSSSYNVGFYVFTDCSKIAATCIAGADKNYSGSAESVQFTPPVTGVYFIGVDSQYAAGSSLSYGTYTVDVQEAKAPKNDTCAGATTLAFPAGKMSITETGNTLFAKNAVSLTSTGCTKNTSGGADVFYKINLVKGTLYKFELDASSFNASMYIFSDCSKVAGSCVKGADEWTSLEEEISFTPTATKDYYIGVDGRASTDKGSFKLTIDKFNKPKNDTCATAAKLTFTGTKATGSGHTIGATNTVKLASTGCTKKDTEGPDVFYSMSLTGGKTYKIKVTPASGYDAAAYVLSSCTNPTSACVSGSDTASSGSAEAFAFSPKTTGTYYLVVDTSYAATSSYAMGKFTLEVEEFKAPKNDSCNTPEKMTWTAGKATASGDTSKATNQVSFASSSGCTDTKGAGTDLFYSVDVTAGKMYQVDVATTTTTYDLAAYAFRSCSAPLTTCLGGSDNALSGKTETFVIKPKTTGPVIIGVDGYSATKAGKFTVSVKEVQGAKNDTCKTAKKITLVGGKATVKDKKVIATNDLKKCGTTALDATDLWYKFTPVVGNKYKITFKPITNGGRFGVWDGSHNCVASAVQTACGVLGSVFVTSGSSDSLTITAKGGDIYFVADGLSSSYNVYDFQFDIVQLTKPANDTCAKAQQIKMVSGKVTVKGDNSAATNTIKMTSSGCTKKAVQGGDIFYKVAVVKGKTYKITVTPGSGFDVAAYVLKGCGTPLNCLGGGDSATSGSKETFTFTAINNGVYTIGVSSSYTTGASYSQGSFTLDMAEYVPAKGDTCAAAIPMTFASGVATAKGDNTNASNKVNLPSSGCTSWVTPGKDQFYSVKLTGGKAYTVDLKWTDTNLDLALYVFTDCTKPAATCIKGSDSTTAGAPEQVKLTPKTTGTYYIAVDAWSKDEVGTYTLTVK